jgi:sterol desaturase/sphingolipid hydroxylase (fatty acid hydroxylase superfamily)
VRTLLIVFALAVVAVAIVIGSAVYYHRIRLAMWRRATQQGRVPAQDVQPVTHRAGLLPLVVFAGVLLGLMAAGFAAMATMAPASGGSGGIGSVSVGVSEALVEAVLVAIVVVLVVGGAGALTFRRRSGRPSDKSP